MDLSKTLALKKQSATLLLISITILITIISFTEIPLSVLQTTVLSYCNFIVINISNCCMHTQCLANYSVQIQSRHYKRKAITPSVISSFTSTLYKRKKIVPWFFSVCPAGQTATHSETNFRYFIVITEALPCQFSRRMTISSAHTTCAYIPHKQEEAPHLSCVAAWTAMLRRL